MFLTGKQLKKVRLVTGTYIGIGAVSVFSVLMFLILGSFEFPLLILGIFCLVFSYPAYKITKFSAGKGKLINSGNNLIYRQLWPEEFINLYNEARNDPENVYSVPDFDVLRLVLTAYSALGDKENELKIVDELYSFAPAEKKTLAKLCKCSVLYDCGKTEEAEEIIKQIQSEKLDMMSKSFLDLLFNTDRAMALGDYNAAELCYRQQLQTKFPKPTPLALVVFHFGIAEICYKTDRFEEAKEHYLYCVENGGRTIYKTKAEEMLSRL